MYLRLGLALRAAGVVGFAVAFLWGMGVCVGIIADEAGSAAAVLSVILAPLTFLLVPWFAGFALDNWLPFLINYCSGTIALALLASGKAMVRGPKA